jgi:hypothetical protein
VGILEEFHNANRVERGFRRRILGIRISGAKVIELRDRLNELIQPPVVVNPLAGAKVATDTSALSPRGVSIVTLRKLREMQAAIIQGESVADVLREAALTEDHFLEQLAANGAGYPALVWLREQLLRDRKLRQSEQQVVALTQVLAAQSQELAELRSARSKVS